MLFALCLLLVLIVALSCFFADKDFAAFNKDSVLGTESGSDELSGAYPVSADGYTHGSNIGRATSGTVYDVSTASDFTSKIASNSNIRLTGSITVNSFSTANYSGTIYGNGNTVTINYTSALSTSAGQSEGGIVGTLTGKIYDLNVKVQANTTIKRGRNSSPSEYNLGIIAGTVNGGTISNCSVTINSGVTIWAFSWRAGDWVSFGGVSGRVLSGNIENVTVVNNGYINVGNASNASVSGISKDVGVATNVLGYINNNSSSLTMNFNNIVVGGSGTIDSYVAANIGMNASANKSLNIPNFYNKFTGKYVYVTLSGGIFGSNTPLVSYTLMKWAGSGDGSTVTNYYASGADESMMKSGFYAEPTNSVEVGNDYSVYFDPKATNLSSSLVVVKTGIKGGEDYYATIANVKQPPFVYSNNYAFTADGSTVVFRNLSTTASDWNSGGNFACTIKVEQTTIEVEPVAPVNKWESSYFDGAQITTGTRVSNGSELSAAIAANQDIYLVNDITDYTGFNTNTYSGTIYGNGHTVYIVRSNSNSSQTVGGLAGTLTGTVKDLRVVLYGSYNRTITTNKIGTGIIAGHINGGTVENVYVYIPAEVTFGANGGSNYESYVGAVAGYSEGGGYNIKNTTVDIDGEIRLDGSWIYMSAFVGKSQSTGNSKEFNFTNVTLRGNGAYASDHSATDEPIFLGASTVLFTSDGVSGNAKLNINGFINDFQGRVSAQNYSMYGILTQNKKTGDLTGWTISVADVYDYDAPLADVNKTQTNNKYIDITNNRAIIATTVSDSAAKVMPYFPAGDTENLVLVAGDGSASLPQLVYGEYTAVADGNYKVVTIPKTAINTPGTVALSEVVQPAEPIEAMNKWENGYTTENVTTGTAVSNGAQLATAIANNEDIYLTGDILDFVGFGHTSTYTGTFNGNGHTVYIVKARSASGDNVGGLFSTLSGTVRNVRVVVTAGIELSNTKYLGGIAGALDANAQVSNVNVIINEGVNLVTSRSGSDVGGVGGIAGGLVNGTGETVTISHSTVVLNGTFRATAQYTFVAGFVAHLNGEGSGSKGAISFADITFKGNGALNGTANGGEGVHTAGAGVVGGNVREVNVDGVINAFTGTLSENRSAYAVIVRNSQDSNIVVNISNVYTYGNVTTYDGEMSYGKPVDASAVTSQIATTVENSEIPVVPYLPEANDGSLVLVAGNGSEKCPTVSYNQIEGAEDGNYCVVTVPKQDVPAQQTVTLMQGKKPVEDPVIATGAEELVYKGSAIDVALNPLMAGSVALTEDDYTIVITAKPDGTGSITDGKPVNAGVYVITVQLLNGYKFADETDVKTLEFTVTPFVIAGNIAFEGSSEYDKTEKTAVFNPDDGKGLFNGDSVVIAYGEEDRINVTEDGFTVTATVPDANYTFADGQSITATLKITARNITVNIQSKTSVYGNETEPLTATLEGSIIEGDENVYSLSTQATSSSDVGTYDIQGTSSNANYNVTFNGGEGAYSITAAQITDVTVTPYSGTYDGADHEAATSYNAVTVNSQQAEWTFRLDQQGEYTAQMPVVRNAAEYTVYYKVSAPNHDTYEGSFTVTVQKADMSVSVSMDGWTYGGAQSEYDVQGNVSEGAVTAHYTGEVADGTRYDSDVKPDKPGSYNIVITVAQTDNYNAAEAQTSFEIAKATLTVSAEVQAKEYTGSEISFDISISEGRVGDDDVSVSEVTYKQNGQVISPVEIGTYDVNVTLAGAAAAYYNVAAYTVEIIANSTQAPDGLTSDSIVLPESLVYDGKAHQATLDYTNGEGDENVYGIVYFNGVSYSLDAPVNAGEYTLYVYKNDINTRLQGVQKTMTISPATLTSDDITTGETQFVYNGEAHAVTASANGIDGMPVEIEVLYNGNSEAPVNAGEYKVTFVSKNANYVVDEGVSVTMSIAKAEVELPVAQELVYNGKEQTAFADSDKYTTGGVAKATDVSAEDYVAIFTLVSDNYKWKGQDDATREVSVSWNIAPYEVSVSLSGEEATSQYTGEQVAQQKLDALFVQPDGVNGEKVEIKVWVKDGVQIINAGEYTVVANVNNANYTAQDVETTYVVTKANPVVNVKIQGVPEKDALLSTVTIMLDEGSTAGTIEWANPETVLVIGNNDVEWIFTPEDTLNYESATGQYTVKVDGTQVLGIEVTKGPDKTEYNAFDEFDGTGMTVSAKMTDGESEYSVELSSEEYTVSVASDDGKLRAGMTSVTVTYGGFSAEISITVNKLSLQVPVAESTEFVYDATEHSVNIATDDRYTVSGDTSATNAGEYVLTISLSDKDNYQWSDASTDDKTVNWTIKAVTITGNIVLPENCVYDGQAKTAEFEVTGGTLYCDAHVVVKYAAADGIATQEAPVNAGEYTVTVELSDTVNYVFDESVATSVTMTVSKKAANLTSGGNKEKVYDGKEVSEDVLAQNFTVEDGLRLVVTVSGKILNAGSYTVSATVADEYAVNYTFEKVSYTYVVKKAAQSVNATLKVGYKSLEIIAQGNQSTVEYSYDGKIWQVYSNPVTVDVEAEYSLFVRYSGTANYNASEAVQISGTITKSALYEYVLQRFAGDITLADVNDITELEEFAKKASGENAEFDARMTELTAKKNELVKNASDAVLKALKAGGMLSGYTVAAVAVAVTLGGLSVAVAAAGLCIKTRRGGKKNENK